MDSPPDEWMTWDRKERKGVSIAPKGEGGWSLPFKGWVACWLSIVWHWRGVPAGGGAGGTHTARCIR